MIELPQRTSLVSQVADIVRRQIERGEWAEFLPGELKLCHHLQVSRPTLRAALESLRREGLVQVSQGRRRRIVAGHQASRPPLESKTIAALTTTPYHALSSFTLFILNELQGHLHNAGFRLETHTHGRFGARVAAHALGALVSNHTAACWVLIGPPDSVQRWFQTRRVPALIIGSPGSSIGLPCLGVDYRAIARHAVGILLSRGHRRVALVTPERAEQDKEDPMEKGFWEGFAAPHPDGVYPAVITHNGSVAGIRAALNSMLRLKNQPTGLLVARPKHVLTVITHLMHSGVKVPEDMSLVSLGHDPILDEVTPKIACYSINWGGFASRLSRLVMQVVGADRSSPRQTLLMPRFEDGATLQTL